MRILVADGDSGAREKLASRLSAWGYEVVAVEGGADAWRILGRDDSPPIAVLGWDLSDLSAVDLCRMLRATPHGAGVYVVVAAGSEAAVDLVEAREAGVDDFLAKPVSARELQFRVAKGVAFREGRPRPRLNSIPPASQPPPSSLTPVAPSVAAAPMPVLGGRYRLERKLASGTVADVWLGVHLSLGINVAIKFVKPDAAERMDYARFERDARAAAQLRSPHLARVHGYGSHEGLAYVVTEYLGGESLSRRVASRGPLSLSEVSAVVDQAAAGLSEAHADGFVHGDVRPETLVITPDFDHPEKLAIKLSDFAFVKAALTQRPEEAGLWSPSFASPEVLKAETEPDAAGDLWALAATAFTLATGARPFGGDTLGQVLTRVCFDPLPVPSAVRATLPPAFDAWFARACARAKASRFVDATEMASALRAIARQAEPPRPAVPRPSVAARAS